MVFYHTFLERKICRLSGFNSPIKYTVKTKKSWQRVAFCFYIYNYNYQYAIFSFIPFFKLRFSSETNMPKMPRIFSTIQPFYSANFLLRQKIHITFVTFNSLGAIVFFRECTPPIRAQIHGKKNEQKTQRQQQQKTRTMTIKDV